MIPQPSGSASSWRAGQGLVMSNSRKRPSPTRACFQSGAAAASVSHWPAASSMTTFCGSLRPDSRAMMVAAGMPMAVAMAARMRLGPDGGNQDGDGWCVQRKAGPVKQRDPDESGSDGTPGAWARLERASTEEGADDPCPFRSCRCGHLIVALGVDAAPEQLLLHLLPGRRRRAHRDRARARR